MSVTQRIIFFALGQHRKEKSKFVLFCAWCFHFSRAVFPSQFSALIFSFVHMSETPRKKKPVATSGLVTGNVCVLYIFVLKGRGEELEGKATGAWG